MGQGPFFPEGSSTLEKIATIGALQQQFGPRVSIGSPQFNQEQFRLGRGGVGGALRTIALGKTRQADRRKEEQEAEQLRQRQALADRLIQGFRPPPPEGGPTVANAAAAPEIPIEALLAQQSVLDRRPQDAQRALSDIRKRQSGQAFAQSIQQAPGIDPQRKALIGQLVKSGESVANVLPFLLPTESQRQSLGQRQSEFAQQQPTRATQARAAASRAATAEANLFIADQKLELAQEKAERERAARGATKALAQSIVEKAREAERPLSRADQLLVAGLNAGDSQLIGLASKLGGAKGITGAMRNEFRALGLDPDNPADVANPKNMQRAFKQGNERFINRERAKLLVARDLPVQPSELRNWVNPQTLERPTAGGNVSPSQLSTQGFVLMDQRSQSTLKVAQQAQTILSDITALALGNNREMSDGRRIAKGAFSNIPEGIFSRAFRGGVMSFQKVAETHAGAIAKEFEQTVDSYLSLFGRAINAESGRFTDKDAERIKGAFPTTGRLTFTGPRFPNSTDFAMDRLRLLQSHLDDIRNRAIAFNAMSQFQIGGQTQGPQPIPFAPQSGFSTTPSGTQFRIVQ